MLGGIASCLYTCLNIALMTLAICLHKMHLNWTYHAKRFHKFPNIPFQWQKFSYNLNRTMAYIATWKKKLINSFRKTRSTSAKRRQFVFNLKYNFLIYKFQKNSMSILGFKAGGFHAMDFLKCHLLTYFSKHSRELKLCTKLKYKKICNLQTTCLYFMVFILTYIENCHVCTQ